MRVSTYNTLTDLHYFVKRYQCTRCHISETVYLRLIFVLQICDFGLAKWKQHAATQTATETRRGTIAYMAPEVFMNPSKSRTIKYDVYGFGIFLWELLSEQKPYANGKDILV